jgi:GNAT superfamily N-acetyltransferase
VIRPPEPGDVLDLLRIGRAFYAASGSEAWGLGYDEDDLVASMAEMAESGFFRVAEADGRVVGAVGGLLVPWYLKRSQRIAHEVWWWVDPGYRGAAGVELLRALEQWARDEGAACLQLASPPSLTDGHSPAAVHRWFSSLGYEWVEASWTRRL